MGIGFPAWTGGVHQFIVGYEGGTAGFVARAKELAAQYGPRFTPAGFARGIAPVRLFGSYGYQSAQGSSPAGELSTDELRQRISRQSCRSSA